MFREATAPKHERRRGTQNALPHVYPQETQVSLSLCLRVDASLTSDNSVEGETLSETTGGGICYRSKPHWTLIRLPFLPRFRVVPLSFVRGSWSVRE